MESELGFPEAFEEIFGILLVDRGKEFDDWAGMARSCLVPGKKKCRVFYCDEMNSNQKAQAERNHEQLRLIFNVLICFGKSPKGSSKGLPKSLQL